MKAAAVVLAALVLAGCRHQEGPFAHMVTVYKESREFRVYRSLRWSTGQQYSYRITCWQDRGCAGTVKSRIPGIDFERRVEDVGPTEVAEKLIRLLDAEYDKSKLPVPPMTFDTGEVKP